MSRAGLWAVLALAACFDPRYREGLACSDAGTCPPGQTCGSDSICRSSVDLAAHDLAVDLAVDFAVDLQPDLTTTGPRCPPLAALGSAQQGQFCGTQLTDADPNTVYLCSRATADGPPLRAYPCALGCVQRPAGMDDYCNAGNCATNGNYCGNDKLAGDPMALYSCGAAGQPAAYLTFCPNGCAVMPQNTPDACK